MDVYSFFKIVLRYFQVLNQFVWSMNNLHESAIFGDLGSCWNPCDLKIHGTSVKRIAKAKAGLTVSKPNHHNRSILKQ